MKVKSLVKTANKSDKINFTNEYDKGDAINIDGCFVPLYKASEDKRPVDSFYMVCENGKNVLKINTVYIPETTSDALSEKKVKDKKNKKKKKKGKK